jgi:glycine/D-amino acid oxidase-like deaminating enzyme/nitrite reductase/ring-hydroxylating ferredoxin subunit
MAAKNSDTTPYWSTSATFPQFAKLAEDAAADVVVIGAGVTGLSAAYLLAKAGKQVIVLERGRCAGTDTGHTSAHLTMVTDTRLRELVKKFGRNHAQAVWDAGLAAMALIDEVIREHTIDAGFEWVDGYLHAPLDDDAGNEADRLEEEAGLARDLGFDAEYVEAAPLVDRPGIRFADQARVHPRAYLAGVAKAFVALGGRIHEHSEAEDFCDQPRAVKVNGRTVSCEDVVIATHNPLVGLGGLAGATLFQTKLALYTSYVIAGRAPRGAVIDALWWDTADPYHYLRVVPHRDFDLLIFGGEDHKTGQRDDTDACYRRLEERLGALVDRVDLTHRWSGQVIETPDGLPYIGQNAEHQYAATGFGGNGLTFGTLAGIMISDAILERSNPWAELFDPGRKALKHGLWDYLAENVDYPYYMIRDRFAGAEARSLRAVKRGQGKIIERNGAKVAAYRDQAGATTLRSAICTHMGCAVAWNTAERTWDCPCHGSRFEPTGEVISGPAEKPLPEAE